MINYTFTDVIERVGIVTVSTIIHTLASQEEGTEHTGHTLNGCGAGYTALGTFCQGKENIFKKIRLLVFTFLVGFD